MRLIKAFKWCKKYNLDQIEVDYDLNNQNVIIYRAKYIKNILHMIEIVNWAKTFPEYRKVLSKPTCVYVAKWLLINWFTKKNVFNYVVF